MLREAEMRYINVINYNYYSAVYNVARFDATNLRQKTANTSCHKFKIIINGGFIASSRGGGKSHMFKSQASLKSLPSSLKS